MDCNPIIHWCVCGNDNGCAGNHGTFTGCHLAGRTNFELFGVSLIEYQPPFFLDRFGKSVQVTEWMKLGLLGKSKAGPSVEKFQRRTLDSLYFFQSRTVRRCEFLFENIC